MFWNTLSTTYIRVFKQLNDLQAQLSVRTPLVVGVKPMCGVERSKIDAAMRGEKATNTRGKILPYELFELYTGRPDVPVQVTFVPMTASSEPIYEPDIGLQPVTVLAQDPNTFPDPETLIRIPI